VKYLAHKKMLYSLGIISETAADFKSAFGRDSGGFIRTYKTEDAETIIVAMGSVVGTLKDMVDDKRGQGQKIGVVSICTFRPFPSAEVCAALKGAKHVIVLEKAVALGQGGVLAAHVREVLDKDVPLTTLIAGLGGRPIFKKSLSEFVENIGTPTSSDLRFLDLRQRIVDEEERKIESERKTSSTKPRAE
jgi:pyruvate ferredoxin oxidoreductase alpha subunit